MKILYILSIVLFAEAVGASRKFDSLINKSKTSKKTKKQQDDTLNQSTIQVGGKTIRQMTQVDKITKKKEQIREATLESQLPSLISPADKFQEEFDKIRHGPFSPEEFRNQLDLADDPSAFFSHVQSILRFRLSSASIDSIKEGNPFGDYIGNMYHYVADLLTHESMLSIFTTKSTKFRQEFGKELEAMFMSEYCPKIVYITFTDKKISPKKYIGKLFDENRAIRCKRLLSLVTVLYEYRDIMANATFKPDDGREPLYEPKPHIPPTLEVPTHSFMSLFHLDQYQSVEDWLVSAVDSIFVWNYESRAYYIPSEVHANFGLGDFLSPFISSLGLRFFEQSSGLLGSDEIPALSAIYYAILGLTNFDKSNACKQELSHKYHDKYVQLRSQITESHQEKTPSHFEEFDDRLTDQLEGQEEGFFNKVSSFVGEKTKTALSELSKIKPQLDIIRNPGRIVGDKSYVGDTGIDEIPKEVNKKFVDDTRQHYAIYMAERFKKRKEHFIKEGVTEQLYASSYEKFVVWDSEFLKDTHDSCQRNFFACLKFILHYGPIIRPIEPDNAGLNYLADAAAFSYKLNRVDDFYQHTVAGSLIRHESIKDILQCGIPSFFMGIVPRGDIESGSDIDSEVDPIDEEAKEDYTDTLRSIGNLVKTKAENLLTKYTGEEGSPLKKPPPSFTKYTRTYVHRSIVPSNMITPFYRVLYEAITHANNEYASSQMTRSIYSIIRPLGYRAIAKKKEYFFWSKDVVYKEHDFNLLKNIVGSSVLARHGKHCQNLFDNLQHIAIKLHELFFVYWQNLRFLLHNQEHIQLVKEEEIFAFVRAIYQLSVLPNIDSFDLTNDFKTHFEKAAFLRIGKQLESVEPSRFYSPEKLQYFGPILRLNAVNLGEAQVVKALELMNALSDSTYISPETIHSNVNDLLEFIKKTVLKGNITKETILKISKRLDSYLSDSIITAIIRAEINEPDSLKPSILQIVEALYKINMNQTNREFSAFIDVYGGFNSHIISQDIGKIAHLSLDTDDETLANTNSVINRITRHKGINMRKKYAFSDNLVDTFFFGICHPYYVIGNFLKIREKFVNQRESSLLNDFTSLLDGLKLITPELDPLYTTAYAHYLELANNILN